MDKLKSLRKLMQENNLDAYIVTSSDAHGSSWVAGHWSGRKWLTGFTGSAGIAVVTLAEAGLWTDGRYFIQAERELPGTGFDLYKMGEPGVPTYEEFILQKFPEGGHIGFDGQTMTFANFDALNEKLNPEAGEEPPTLKFSFDQEDLLGQIWSERPPMSSAPAFEHLPQFAGLSAGEKLHIVREKMQASNITAYLVTGLDDVAWLLNIRGNDLPSTPVVYAFTLITEKDAFVFVDSAKIADICSKLISQGFTLEDYWQIESKIKSLPHKGKIYFNPNKTSTRLAYAIPDELEEDSESVDIITILKAVKSDIELANIRNAFIKEGAAMTKLIKWVDDAVKAGKLFTEDDVATTLISFRKEQEHYIGDSFHAIAAYAANGAQAHYRHEGSGATVMHEGFLLLDTGGQYLDGTTDTTRTLVVGTLTDEMKKDFTIVLKGHMNLQTAVFTKGTTGHALDMLARQPILQDCQNYNHGTGHGIGYCLGVHEGPQGVASRHSDVSLVPGMILSNEPAIYKEGRYGIRTENVIAVKEFCENKNGIFYSFENLTFCPYDTRAINPELLTQAEKDYVNAYHLKVQNMLAPLLTSEEQVWLKEYCLEI